MNTLDKLFYAVLVVATVAVLLWMSPECVPDETTADLIQFRSEEPKDFLPDVNCVSILQIWTDEKKLVSLSWESGKLELIGDPNDYTEAAKIFLTEGLRAAAIDLVAADPNAIRKLAKDGHLCEVLGHRWRGGRPGEDGVIYADIHPDTWYRTCTICGKCESRSMTEWGQ